MFINIQYMAFNFWGMTHKLGTDVLSATTGKGSIYQTALRSLAFKWIRILYRCWKPCEAYDGSRHLKAREQLGSPLVKTREVLESA